MYTRKRRALAWTVASLAVCVGCSAADGQVDDPATAEAVGAVGEVEPDRDGSAQPSATGGAEHVVEIEIFQFGREAITVAPGDTVRWQNNDEILHTVTSGVRTYGDLGVVTETVTDGLFDFSLDGRIPDESSASYTFDEPGVFSMICTIHPGIDMTVEVAP